MTGESATSVGRIASCASCIFLSVLALPLESPIYCCPKLSAIYVSAAATASSDILVESVLRYVIRPIVPRPFMSTPSYSCWAILMVFDVAKLSLDDASCCIVLVVNGSGGFLFLSLSFMDFTTYSPPSSDFNISSSAARPDISSLFVPSPVNLKVIGFFILPAMRFASNVQYSCGMKSFISFSLSHTSLSATDWTRPAERPLLIFAQRTGLIL